MDVKEQIKSRLISDVIKQFIPLKNRHGNRFVAQCPFHNERTPSFYVNDTKGIFKCFGCGEAGDAISFVQKYKQIDYNESLQLLAKLLNIEYTPYKQSKELIILNNYHNKLTLNENSIAILNKRNIPLELANQFELRTGSEVSTEQESVGLKKSFKSRLLFPFKTANNTLVGYGCLTEHEKPKYINSEESNIFQKSNNLFGLQIAKRHIIEKKEAIITEGYFDVLTAHKFNLNNTVGISGTSLTEYHAKILAQYTDSATLAFDGDIGGIKAAMRALPILLPYIPILYISIFKDGGDMDSSLNKGEQFKKELWIDLFIKSILKQENIQEKKRKEEHTIELILLISNSSVRNYYIDKFASSLSLNKYDIIKNQKLIPSENLLCYIVLFYNKEISNLSKDIIETSDYTEGIESSEILLNFYSIQDLPKKQELMNFAANNILKFSGLDFDNIQEIAVSCIVKIRVQLLNKIKQEAITKIGIETKPIEIQRISTIINDINNQIDTLINNINF